MKPQGMFLALFAAVVLTAGCQRSEDQSVIPPADAPMAESPAPIQELPAVPDEQVVSGRISQVDPETRTFTVVAADAEHVFSFSDDTAVMGPAGRQGLAGSEGERVNVRYREELGANMAVRIDLLE